jgi:serine/threonine protein kinase
MRLKAFLLTVEEYIEHISWDDCIDELKKEQNLVDFLIHIFKALSRLWSLKIVHRDLKPENILVKEDLRPIIIDLGIAKSFRDGTMDLTHYAFQTPCTPRYAAPEQLTNSKTEITYKTDQFSVGVMAYTILAGRFPYGDELEVGVEQVVDNFVAGRVEDLKKYNDNINVKLALLIHKLIQVKPYKRFRNADTILQKLYEMKGAVA